MLHPNVSKLSCPKAFMLLLLQLSTIAVATNLREMSLETSLNVLQANTNMFDLCCGSRKPKSKKKCKNVVCSHEMETRKQLKGMRETVEKRAKQRLENTALAHAVGLSINPFDVLDLVYLYTASIAGERELNALGHVREKWSEKFNELSKPLGNLKDQIFGENGDKFFDGKKLKPYGKTLAAYIKDDSSELEQYLRPQLAKVEHKEEEGFLSSLKNGMITHMFTEVIKKVASKEAVSAGVLALVQISQAIYNAYIVRNEVYSALGNVDKTIIKTYLYAWSAFMKLEIALTINMKKDGVSEAREQAKEQVNKIHALIRETLQKPMGNILNQASSFCCGPRTTGETDMRYDHFFSLCWERQKETKIVKVCEAGMAKARKKAEDNVKKVFALTNYMRKETDDSRGEEGPAKMLGDSPGLPASHHPKPAIAPGQKSAKADRYKPEGAGKKKNPGIFAGPDIWPEPEGAGERKNPDKRKSTPKDDDIFSI